MLQMKPVPLQALLVLWEWKRNCLLSICGPQAKVWIRECDHVSGQISTVTFCMLLWCFCSLSRSVGRATLMNLWIGASKRLSVSLLPSSAMCPADGPQPTPPRNLRHCTCSALYHCPHRRCKYQQSPALMNTLIKYVTHASMTTHRKLAPP